MVKSSEGHRCSICTYPLMECTIAAAKNNPGLTGPGVSSIIGPGIECIVVEVNDAPGRVRQSEVVAHQPV